MTQVLPGVPRAPRKRVLPAAMARVSRALLIFGSFVAAVGAVVYPIYVLPLQQIERYSEWPRGLRPASAVQRDASPRPARRFLGATGPFPCGPGQGGAGGSRL